METQDKKHPVQKLRVGAIRASIWENQTKEGAPFYSISFTRSFKVKKNGTEEWADSTISVGAKHLDDLENVLAQAKGFVEKNESKAA